MNINAVSFHSNRGMEDQNMRRIQQQQEEEEKRKSIYGGNLNIGNKDGDDILKNLQSQLEKKQRDIDELSANQLMPAEEKKKKLKELEQQQADLQAQINQRNMEIQEEERKKTEEEMKKMMEQTNVAKNPEKEMLDAKNMRVTALTNASLALEEVGALNRLKVKASGANRDAESELKMAMGYVGSNLEGKYRAVNDTANMVNRVQSRLNQKLSDAIESASKLGEVTEKEKKAEKNTASEDKDSVMTAAKQEERNQKEESAQTIDDKDK